MVWQWLLLLSSPSHDNRSMMKKLMQFVYWCSPGFNRANAV